LLVAAIALAAGFEGAAFAGAAVVVALEEDFFIRLLLCFEDELGAELDDCVAWACAAASVPPAMKHAERTMGETHCNMRNFMEPPPYFLIE